MVAAGSSRSGAAIDALLESGAIVDMSAGDKDGHNVFWLLSHNDKMSGVDKKRSSDRILEFMRK